jgi:carbonic anhydrase
MIRRQPVTTAEQALQLLKEGNDRFVQGLRSVHAMMSSETLSELAENGQRPYVLLLSCSDSRVPAEILFDQGAGDIFVCRVAGNVVTPAILGSLEFAADQFAPPLCLVMGHTRCGAIQATLTGQTGGKAPPDTPNLVAIVGEIQPAIQTVLNRRGKTGDPLALASFTDEAAHLNTRHSIEMILQRSALIRGLVEAGRLKLQGAICDIATGKVDFI